MAAWDPKLPAPIQVGKVNQDLLALTTDCKITWYNTTPPNETTNPGWDQWKRMLSVPAWNP